MARSSLLGIEQAAAEFTGHDTASLGPSDTSDTGSDIIGIDGFDDDDAMVPVDVAIDADRPHVGSAGDERFGIDGGSDFGGTGERRSAGGDSGIADGADIAPDRIVSHPDADLDDEGDDAEVEALLAGLDDGGASESDDAEDDPDEDAVGVEADPALRPRARRNDV